MAWFRVRLLLAAILILAMGTVGFGNTAWAKSAFKKKADDYAVYQLFLKKGSRYNILAKYAEQLGSAYEKSIKYRIYNDLRKFYKSMKPNEPNMDTPTNVTLYAGNRRDFVGCAMGMGPSKYKKSGQKLVPWANFYVMRSGTYQTIPATAGNDIKVVICTTVYKGDNLQPNAYPKWVYKRLKSLFAALSEVDGITAARLGDKPAFDDSPISEDDLVEALLGEPMKSNPKQWREERIGQAAAEADDDFCHWELGPYFDWSKVSLPNGWMFAGFLGNDGMLYHAEEIMLKAINTKSASAFAEFSTHATANGALLAVKEYLSSELDELAPSMGHGKAGLSLISSLPDSAEVFDGAKVMPLTGDAASVLAAARSNLNAYKTYLALNASTPLSRAYRAYAVIEQALARGAFDDVLFFAREGLDALSELPKEKVPKKAESVFKQLSNRKLLPLIRQNMWLKQLAKSQYGGLEQISKNIDNKQDLAAEFIKHNLAGVAVITPRYTSSGEISSQFKAQMLSIIRLNLAYLRVLDALKGAIEQTGKGLQVSTYGVKPKGSVRLPVIGFDESLLANPQKDTARFYKVKEVATITKENSDMPVSVMIGLRQRVEVQIDGAVMIGGMTVKIDNLIRQSSSISCPDAALVYKFVENGTPAKEVAWKCLDKRHFLFNPERKMFVDYGTLYIKTNKPLSASADGVYVIEISREIVRQGESEESSPLVDVHSLFVSN